MSHQSLKGTREGAGAAESVDGAGGVEILLVTLVANKMQDVCLKDEVDAVVGGDLVGGGEVVEKVEKDVGNDEGTGKGAGDLEEAGCSAQFNIAHRQAPKTTHTKILYAIWYDNSTNSSSPAFFLDYSFLRKRRQQQQDEEDEDEDETGEGRSARKRVGRPPVHRGMAVDPKLRRDVAMHFGDLALKTAFEWLTIKRKDAGGLSNVRTTAIELDSCGQCGYDTEAENCIVSKQAEKIIRGVVGVLQKD